MNSKSDLALREDLRDVTQLIIGHRQAGLPIDAEFARNVNETMTRSGALRPGEFRRQDQGLESPPATGGTLPLRSRTVSYSVWLVVPLTLIPRGNRP